jgi:hypothetical protein
MAPGQQVGTAGFPGTTAHAGMWSGTPGSWVDLHPANASYSWGYGTCGTAQVGAAVIPGAASAVIWFGSAQSMVSLHQFLPAGEYFQSVAMGVSFFNGQFYVSGQATRTSDHVNEAWLWVGVPSPGGATVLLTFGGMLAARRRRV